MKILPESGKIASALIALTELYVVAVGLNGRSSGEVYALAMGAGVSLDNHESIVRQLFAAGVLAQGQSRLWLNLAPLGVELHGAILSRHAVLGTEVAV